MSTPTDEPSREGHDGAPHYPGRVVPQPLAAALGRVTSGLYVLTAGTGEAATGMLASWVAQAGFIPPAVTVAVANDRPVEALLTAGSKVVLNVLKAGDKASLVHFGKGFPPGQPAFAGVEVDRGLAPSPVLKAAAAWLAGEVTGHVNAGDHTVYVVKVTDGAVLADGDVAVHTRKTGLHY